jgi:hypothetical protein
MSHVNTVLDDLHDCHGANFDEAPSDDKGRSGSYANSLYAVEKPFVGLFEWSGGNKSNGRAQYDLPKHFDEISENGCRS